MSSSVYALPLRLERRFSPTLAWTVGGVHLLAVAVLPPLAWPWWAKLILAIAVLMQGLFIWRRHVTPSAPDAIQGLLWKSDGDWELSYVNGKVCTARLRRASYVHPALVILRFVADAGGRYAVLLPADGVDAELHRRLRVALRLQAEVV